MLHHLKLSALAGLFMLSISPSVQAEEKDWRFSVRGGFAYMPSYEGSNHYDLVPLPDFSAEYKNGLFFASIYNGIGSYPLQGENYKLGASIEYIFDRKESDDRNNLRGMGTVHGGIAASLMGEYNFGFVQLKGKLTTGAKDYGTTAKIELGTHYPLTERTMLMGSVGTTWANDKHMRNYFGVSSTQSVCSGYQRYNAGSGFKSVGFSIGATHSLTKNWDIKLLISGDRLLSDAANSPIVKRKFNSSVFFSIGYKF